MLKETPVATGDVLADEQAAHRMYGEPKIPSNALADAFNICLRWIDVNLLPILSLAILCGLAAVGFSTFLLHLSYTWKVGISIAVAAFLAVKASNR